MSVFNKYEIPPCDNARQLAVAENISILLVSGPIPMDIGYPQKSHRDAMQMISLTSLADPGRRVALYRVSDRDLLSEVIDDMENHGGYRCSLYLKDGNIDPGYCV